MPFERFDLKELEENVFKMIGDQWMLVTAGSREEYNTMTASWGTLGVLWNQPIATIYVRPQRYTREFLEASDGFTLSFLPGKYRKALAICGAKSGRDTNKVSEAGLTPIFSSAGRVFFEQAEIVFLCRKLYSQDIDPSLFSDETILDCYPNKDYHRMYIGEITQALVNRPTPFQK